MAIQLEKLMSPTEWCVRHKLHLAACSLSAAWAWSGLLHAPLHAWDILVIPTTVLCVYQWNRLTDVSEDQLNCPEELASAVEHSTYIKLFCLSTAAFLILLPTLLKQSEKGVIVTICLVLGYLYGTPRLLTHGFRRLKDLPITKNFSSGLGWALLTVLYPVTGGGRISSVNTLLAFSFMLTAVMMVEMTWDIRDISGDRRAGVRSLPVVFGIGTTRFVIRGLNFLTGAVLLMLVLGGQLSSAWALILLNLPLMEVSGVVISDHIKLRRPWSNALVLLQSAVLVGLGAIARYARTPV